MRRFLFRLGLFLLPILALLCCLEMLLRRIPNDYSRKDHHLSRHGREIRFLVLGNSHAYHGVDPDRMAPGGFNAANISQDYRLDLAILERHLAGMPDLEHIFIPLSFGSLGAQLEEGPEAWREKNYVLYMGIPPVRFALKHRMEVLNRPMADQVRSVHDHLRNGKDHVRCSSSGWGQARPLAMQDLVTSGREAAERHRKEDRCANGNADLNRLIALAAERGIMVHLFLPPAWITYRNMLDAQQLSNVRRTGKELAANFPNVTFDDLLEDQRFTRSDLADADHLSSTGAMKLSSALSAYLK